MLQLQLLGAARLHTGDSFVDLPHKQVLLLGAYLAYKEDWCSRDELLHLFWPDEAEKTARHNLSQLLYHAKGQAWLAGLEAERTRVRWLIDSDVGRFREAVGAGDWGEASRCYGGQLLEGVGVETSLTFEDWLAQERESLQGAWREAALNHANTLRQEKDYGAAARLLRDVLSQESLAEDVVQAYMQAAFDAGQRDQAQKTYEAFSRHLLQELGMKPLETTQQLARDLRSQPSSAPLTPSAQPPGPALHTFPNSPTPFVGRDLERAELAGFLKEDRRLVTLLGPGGIGKTRLALQVAREQAHRFRDGAVFVGLAPVEQARFIPQALTEALSLSVPTGGDELGYLKTFLRDRAMLLVFDNLEHLPDAALLISDLLGVSPASTVLATSREALDVQGEAIYDLKGLLYPSAATGRLEDYDAVTLFLRSARRAHPTFAVTENNRGAVVALCRQLEGMPLGLELAAAWTRLLGPAELVEELGKNLDLLESSHKDLSARHRSMRAVLEHSWNLLGDAEQDALKRLAVFQGGFNKTAAQEVTGTSLRTLLSLINKSLLGRSETGRFERLVVVRQFCLEKLSEQPDLLAGSQQAHAEYFVALAEKAQDSLEGPQKAQWLETLAQDHSNLRSALRWLIEGRNEALGLRLGNALFSFWWLRGHYREGRAFMNELLGLSQECTPERARALSTAGSMARLCEDMSAAKALYEQSLAMRRSLGGETGLAATLGNLGMIYRLEGHYEKAKRLVEESLALYEQAGEQARVANGLNNLAAIAVNLGDKEEAWRLNEASLKLANSVGERFIAARSLGNLGALALDKGEPNRARNLREASLEVFEELGYGVGIAATQQGLGEVALAQGRYPLAREKYLAALRSFEDLADVRGVAEVAGSMTDLLMALQQYERAMRLLGASLSLSATVGVTPEPEALDALEAQRHRAEAVLGRVHAAHLLSEGKRLSAQEAVQLMLEPVPMPADKVTDSH